MEYYRVLLGFPIAASVRMWVLQRLSGVFYEFYWCFSKSVLQHADALLWISRQYLEVDRLESARYYGSLLIATGFYIVV